MKKGFEKKSVWQKYVAYRKLKTVIFRKACVSPCKRSLGFHSTEREPRTVKSLDHTRQLPKPASS